jgi:hypothetical protein
MSIVKNYFELEPDDPAAEHFNIREYVGWTGAYTTDQAKGAYANGTVVLKAMSELGDLVKNGARGRVLGSMHHPGMGYGYFVEWDQNPRVAVLVTEKRLRRA